MAIEIEAKMAVLDLAPVREALRAAGARRVGLTFEINTFFDTEDRLLLAGDEGLRLRTNRDMETRHESHVITFKGPQQAGALKTREEIELTVSERHSAERLFERLRFMKVLSFEKRRESWRLDKCKIELDEVPYLGAYVEIEGPGEPEVMAAREKLGLADRPIIKTSYIAMLMAHLKEQGLSTSDVTFPAPT